MGFIPEQLETDTFPRVRRRRRAGRGMSAGSMVIAVAAAACVIAAALVIHYGVASAGRARRGRGAGAVWQWSRHKPTAEPATNPAEVASRPLAAVGLERLRELPPDVIVPEPAEVSYAFRRALPDGVMDNLVCLAECDVPTAEAFYRTGLKKAGYRFLSRRSTTAGGGVELLFLRESKDYCRVSLRRADKGKRVRIALVVSRLAD